MADELFVGIKEWQAAMKERIRRMEAETRSMVAEGAHAIEAQTKENMSTAGRHKKGTPTPATHGSGPAVISGTLRRSVHVVGPRSLGFATYEAMVGPTTVYGRRIELEYDYPSLEPAVRKMQPTIQLIARKHWRRAW